MKKRKILTSILSMIMLSVLLIPATGLKAIAAGPTLTTTLSDQAIVRNDRLTFDVWARNQAGKKISSTVTLNSERVSFTWDDSDKTSYTLVLSKAGENTVVVSASSDGGKKKQLIYHITYKPAEKGEIIGNAVWSVEVFTLGCGYLIQPVSIPIRAGETAAAELVRLLHENGFVGYHSGSVDTGFYLAYIADGTASDVTYNGYKKSGTATNPQKLGLNPSIPGYLQPHLKSGMDFFDPTDYRKNWTGYLGEFVISNGSGWMYCVNNNFPNVGFSDMYLSDGDVVRVQFTLGYGADIGGMSALGGQIPGVYDRPQSGYYPAANKDGLTRTMAKALSSGLMTRNNVKNAYADALSAAATLNSSQSTVDSAVKTLENALKNPDSAADSTSNTENNKISGSSGNAGNLTTDGNSVSNKNAGNLVTGESSGSNKNAGNSPTGGNSGSNENTGNSAVSGNSWNSRNSGSNGNAGVAGNSESPGNNAASVNTGHTLGTASFISSESSSDTENTTFPETREETDSSGNTTDKAQTSGTMTSTGGETSENTAKTNQNVDDTRENRPIFVIGIILAVLAAVFAVFIGIHLHGKKTSFRNTDNKE